MFSLLFHLLLSRGVAAGSGCEGVDPNAIMQASREALAARRWREVLRIAEQWQADAPCVADSLSPSTLSRPFQYAGIAAHEAGRRDEARAWFITTLTVNPNEELDLRILQRLSSDVERSFNAMSVALAGASERAVLRVCTPAVVDGRSYQPGERISFYNGTHLLAGEGVEPQWVSLSSDIDHQVGGCPAAEVRQPSRTTPGGHGAPDATAQRIVEIARETVGRRAESLLSRPDCSGLMEYILGRAGLSDWVGRVRDMFDYAKKAEVYWTDGSGGVPGDLVFFRNTHDRNHNGLLDDEWTHIAVVVGSRPDGTLELVHKGGQTGISLIRMNLTRPGDRDVNSQIRVEPDATGRLPVRTTGETFAAMASPWRVSAP